MTFDLQTIAIFCGGAIVYSAILPRAWRKWALLIASVVLVYWLQPALTIRYSDYLLPTLTIIVSVIGWWWTRPQTDAEAPHPTRDDWTTLGVILALQLSPPLQDYGQEAQIATIIGIGGLDWPAVAAALGVAAVMVVRADGGIELTPAIQPRILFTDPAYGERARVRALP